MNSIGRKVGRILRYFQDKTGVSAVEYALIVVAVIGIVGAGMAVLAGDFQQLFTDVENQMKKATSEVKAIDIT